MAYNTAFLGTTQPMRPLSLQQYNLFGARACQISDYVNQGSVHVHWIFHGLQLQALESPTLLHLPSSPGLPVAKLQMSMTLAHLLTARSAATIATLVPLLLCFCRLLRAPARRNRSRLLPPHEERIVILGASSGTGAALARAYARRSPRRLVLVARRAPLLACVQEECVSRFASHTTGSDPHLTPNQAKARVQIFEADCGIPEDVHRLMNFLQDDGVDTVHLCFGASALKPLLGVAGVDPVPYTPSSPPATDSVPDSTIAPRPTVPRLSGLQNVAQIMAKMSETNQSATALTLAALVPLLQTTSPRPVVGVLSSVAALVPAPTRALYGAAKAAQLVLVEGIALEAERQAFESGRTRVRFATILPGTIATGFRSSAVDLRPNEQPENVTRDSSWDQSRNHGEGSAPLSRASDEASLRTRKVPAGDFASSSFASKPARSDILTSEQVADAMICAADQEKSGRLALPSKYAWALRIQPFAPDFLARKAHRKYGY